MLNKLKTKLFLLVPLTALLCIGCSNKDVDIPAETLDIDNRFELQSLWSASTGGMDGFFSQLQPAVSQNNVFMASRSGDVTALSLDDGDKLWTTDLGDEQENDNKRSARLSGGVSATLGKISVGSENGYIYVLNSHDGKVIWKDYLGCEVVTPPAFSQTGDKLFVLDSNGRVVAYNALNGEKLWISGGSTTSLHLRSQSKPLSVGDEYLIIGSSTGQVIFLSQDNGMILSTVIVNENYGSTALQRVSDVSSTPLLLDGKMYTTAYNGGFVTFDFDKNSVVNRLTYHSSQDIAFDEDYFVITSDNGYIYCIDRNDGSELWLNTKLKNRNVTAPVVYGNYAVVGDFEGYLYFLNLATGVIEGMFDLDSSAILTAPKVIGGNLLVSFADGSVDLVSYDPNGLARTKSALASDALAFGRASAKLKPSSLSDYSIGLTEEQLQERRQHAIALVAKIEAQQRAAEAQIAEYNRRKAEYERQKKAYEEQRRKELSGFGIMPGVKSHEEETSQDDTSSYEDIPQEPTESDNEKSSSFGI